MSDYDEIRNKIERQAEARFPGYKGLVWGQVTEASNKIVFPDRTQITFTDGTSYWLDVPAGSVTSGDRVTIIESLVTRIVSNTGMTLGGDCFDPDYRGKVTIPHRIGTFVELHRKAVNATWEIRD